MILEWFQLSLLEWILIAALLLVFLIQIFFYIRYFCGIIRRFKRDQKEKKIIETEQKPVSIIICARDQAVNLKKNLPAFFEQDYSKFQVVVVNDASSDDTENILIHFEKDHPNFYHTFVPQGIQSVSAKKIAMTIGIKAAKYDQLIFTEAYCIPQSNHWLSSMARHFDEHCGIVLGFSTYIGMKGLLKQLVSYDTLFMALQFMGFSEAGKPYMGIGRNLAYCKQLFFDNRGFASHLCLKSGDDDLFIGEIANRTNTQIEISPESKVLTKVHNVWRHWKDQKVNQLTNTYYYKSGTKFRIKLEEISRVLFYGLFLTLLIVGVVEVNPVPAVFAAVAFLIRYGMQLFVINKSARMLEETRHYFLVPFFDILLLLISFWLKIEKHFKKENNYTWKVLH